MRVRVCVRAHVLACVCKDCVSVRVREHECVLA